uniref:Large ribosomal subunit protein uL2c n=1 Tax=Palmophyllum crassum TaxID=1615899 RepID=A0A1L7NXV8_9VIRI|nr:ribosomal protein L2 [Palmophyllum crassum]BAW34754.1 ribosomal protein L2 [Palmophyllum crassum]
MGIRFYKPYTPGTRNFSRLDFAELTKKKPEKKLTFGYKRAKGKNNRGILTIRHRGGGHKRCYRQIDFWRRKIKTTGLVKAIEYDPNRNSFIALIHYETGQKSYILAPQELKVGNKITSGKNSLIEIGNHLPLKNIPLGTQIHNIEFIPGKGGQIARAAGSVAQLIAKEKNGCTIRLPSSEVRIISNSCWATIGQVSNIEIMNTNKGKAGRTRWLGIRPTVRGSVMNPVDHPHGGGEGRAPIGKKQPVTPWGKATLGLKTRSKKKYSNQFILRQRKK